MLHENNLWLYLENSAVSISFPVGSRWERFAVTGNIHDHRQSALIECLLNADIPLVTWAEEFQKEVDYVSPVTEHFHPHLDRQKVPWLFSS